MGRDQSETTLGLGATRGLKKARREADRGNLFVVQSLEACRAAHTAGALFLTEHPEHLGRTASGHVAASIWQLAEMTSLANECGAIAVAIYQCEWGAETLKPTRFLSTLAPSSLLNTVGHQGWPRFREGSVYSGPLPDKCPHGFHSKKLLGQQDGVFVTAAAANYPAELCEMLSASVISSFLKMSPVGEEDNEEKGGELTSDDEEDGFRRPLLRDHLGGIGPPLKLDCQGSRNSRKEFQDGCGLCSPGRWHPDKRQPISSFGKALSLVLDTWLAKHVPNVPALVFRLATGKVLESPFSDTALAELRKSWFSLLPDPEAAAQVRLFQPFYLSAIGQSLHLVGDPDARVMTEAHFNFTKGVPVWADGTKLPRTPAVFPRKDHWRRYSDSTFCAEMQNYQTAASTGKFLEEQFQKDTEARMMYLCTMDEAKSQFGDRLRLAAQGAVEKGSGEDMTWRIVHDGTFGVQVNHCIRPRDQLVAPSAAEGKASMRVCACERPGVHFNLVADIRQAHRRFVHAPED